MMLLTMFFEGLKCSGKNFIETSIALSLSTLESYIIKRTCSKMNLNNSNYNKRSNFCKWCVRQKEFKNAFEYTDESGYIGYQGLYIKKMQKETLMIVINVLQAKNGNGYQKENANCEIRTIVYFLGKYHKSYLKALKEFLDQPQNELPQFNAVHNIYEVTKDGTRQSLGKNTRKMETIFSPQKKQVIDFLLNWMKLGDLYAKYEITYKTGILLYGKPGTGKTSFAKAIANYTHREILIIDLSRSLDSIKRNLNNFNNSVILFEDIDCFLKNRENCITTEEETKLNFLLNVLDGVYSMNNCIYIATTNYIDKIDEAFKRPGRFNMVIEITELGEKEAAEMCDYYEIPRTYTQKLTYPVNPADLQMRLLKERVAQLNTETINFVQDVDKIIKKNIEKNDYTDEEDNKELLFVDDISDYPRKKKWES